MSDITNDDVVKALGNLTVLEMIALTKELEQKWGVEAKPQAVQVQQQQNQPKTATQEEWNVVLTSVPAAAKMSVIKVVREVMGLGLKESKDLVESAPKAIKEAVSKEEALELQTKLTAAGAVVEVK
jgi:large subunit ribosomal protein L7/L12